ncbi:MAG: aminotransferase class V-fold PLP-dependent enzyme [Pseudomonadales bacterium]
MEKFNALEAMANSRHEFGEHGGVNMSIEASTAFTVMEAGIMPEIFQGRMGPDQGGCYLYGRHFNPTVYNLGKQLAAMEGTEAAYCTASGMSAIAAAIIQLCSPGDHLIASDTIYGGTFALFKEFLPAKLGLEVTFVDPTDHDSIKAAFKERTRLLYIETVSNPTMKVADIPALAALAHSNNAKLVVDNTFTPMIVSPAQWGADIVVHSLTKFINGASDIIAGAICADTEFINQLMDLHMGALMLLGPTMDPNVAFHVSSRLPHLGLRMVEHSQRARTFSLRLEDMSIPVMYPGLESHPQHEVLKKMAHPEFGFGGLFAIDVGTTEKAFDFMNTLQNECQFGYLAVSLGYFDTLMSCSASSTASEMAVEDLQTAGISPGLVRISIGFTGSLEQRWEQFCLALRRVELIN